MVMTNFNNLVFVSHPMNPTKAIMAKYRFNNGKELSVVAGEGLYSNSKNGIREAVNDVNDVASFEVMFDNEVSGWQTREDINRIFIENN